MSAIRLLGWVCVTAVLGVTTSRAGSQGDFGDAAAIVQFQRNVDSYALAHRQVQRRLGESADQRAMAAGMRAARPSATDGDLFTPIVAAAFRSRIAIAIRKQDCNIAAPGAVSSEVPRVGALASGTKAAPSCLLGALPRLPVELEYRVASVALILLDTHANIVVDVLHGAFPTPDDR
jgi:hypothetical protein